MTVLRLQIFFPQKYSKPVILWFWKVSNIWSQCKEPPHTSDYQCWVVITNRNWPLTLIRVVLRAHNHNSKEQFKEPVLIHDHSSQQKKKKIIWLEFYLLLKAIVFYELKRIIIWLEFFISFEGSSILWIKKNHHMTGIFYFFWRQ